MADTPDPAKPATGDAPDPAKPEETPKPPETPAGDEAALGDAGKKALDAERNARKAAEKAAADALAKVKEFEDATKSKEEKLVEENGSLKSENETLATKLLRLEVAADKNVPAELRELLTGNTREEIEAKAELLVAHLKPGGGTPPPGSFDGGAREGGNQKPTLAEQIKAAEAAKDTGLVMRLKATQVAQNMTKASS